MDISLWCLFFSVSLGEKICAKLSSNCLKANGAYSYFFTINGTVACLYFLIASGFRLSLDLPTAMFALLYAGVILLSLYFGMKALQSLPIVYHSTINSTGNLVLTSILGVILFYETVRWQSVLRIILMLAATFLIFYDRKGSARLKKFPVLVAFGCISAGVGNYLVLKFYTIVPHQASDASFFFFTNLILVIVAVGWFLLKQQKFSVLSRSMLPFMANTLCSNTVSLISILLIARTDAIFYTPISSALGTLCVILASIIFKEKIGLYSYIAAGLTTVAVIL